MLRRDAGAGDETQMDLLAACDYLIELGPEGGEAGGYLTVAGTPNPIQGPKDFARCTWIPTSRFPVAGDFNIAPEDRDVFDPVAWAGQIHCTPEERAQFARLLGLGLHDAFRLFEQPPKSWSWWDYRNLAFRKNQGLRIDHILVSDALKPRVTACAIDKLPRKNERPSDHAPVWAELKQGRK